MQSKEDIKNEKPRMTFTIEDAVEAAGFGFFQIKMILIAGSMMSAEAMEMLLLSVLAPTLRCEWYLTSFQVALITTVVFIGFLVGAPFWGKMADKYGRRTVFFLVLCIVAFFGLLTALSHSFFWIILFRGVVGFGIGGIGSGFTLQSEYLSSKYRATVLLLTFAFWGIGSSFEVLLSYFILPIYGWRVLVFLTSLPSIGCLLLINFLPESARFQMACGQKEQALETIKEMFRLNKKEMLPGILVEEPISEADRGNFVDLFNVEYCRSSLTLFFMWFTVAFSYYGVILISSEMATFQEKCSYIVIQKNQQTLYDNSCCSGITDMDYKTMIWSSFGELFFLPFNMAMVELLGRKYPLKCGYLVTSSCFFLLCLCMKEEVSTLLIFFIRGFTSICFNVLYIYTVELYPTTIRALSIGFCSAIGRIGCILTPFVAEVVLPEFSLYAALLTYAILNFLSLIATISLPIETKGREMQHSLTKKGRLG